MIQEVDVPSLFLLSVRGTLNVVSATGGEPRALTTSQYAAGEATGSLDGQRIAFASDRTGNFQVWTMTPSGTELRQVTSSGSYNVQPC